MRVYVASSWRNPLQPGIVALLREAGHEVYDFPNPRDGDTGFHWSEVDPEWQGWSPARFPDCLGHQVAQAGFQSDFLAIQ